MKDGRIDFEPTFGPHDDAREDRVARRVMRTVHARPAPRQGLADAIVALAPLAMAAAVALVLATRLVSGAAAPQPVPPTVGVALGMPAAAERVIRSPEPTTGWELLTAFQADR